MKLLTTYVRFSPKNGFIIFYKYGGAWEVVVNAAKQTSRNYPAMWKRACQEVPPDRPVHNVLMLGLAGGGALAPVYEAFPHCEITAVEYDPEMASIAKEIRLFAPHPEPHILIADAKDVVTGLSAQYDLIIVDLFFGIKLSPLVRDHAFLQALRTRLSPGGTVLVNLCTEPGALEPIREIFPYYSVWTYNSNTFAAVWM